MLYFSKGPFLGLHRCVPKLYSACEIVSRLCNISALFPLKDVTASNPEAPHL